MPFRYYFILILIATGLLSYGASYLLSILIKKLGFVAESIQHPVLEKIPTMGGLAILFSFLTSYFLFLPKQWHFTDMWAIVIGMFLITLTGMIDDIFVLTVKQKSIGIILSTLWLLFTTDLQIDTMTLFNGGLVIEFGFLSYVVTLLWFYLSCNSINLIDGLDGLATGISIIVLMALSVIGFFFTEGAYQIHLSFMLIFAAALVGFLVNNFYPAKIFLGDTGALLIGYTLALISSRGLKNATLISLLVPIIVMATPFTDVLIAVVRRLKYRRPLTLRDHEHLHHQMLRVGFSHRETVLMMYSITIIAGISAILASFSGTFWMLLGSLSLLTVYIGVVLFLSQNKQ